jgi:CRP-like cAMP-binding protein
MVAVRTRPNDAAPLVFLDEALLRPSRRDALPEHTRYVDSGCSVHSSCLTCPLVRCRYDDPGGIRALLSVGRDERILALRQQGRMTVKQIAERLGVSRRTVFRVLARARASQEEPWQR